MCASVVSFILRIGVIEHADTVVVSGSLPVPVICFGLKPKEVHLIVGSRGKELRGKIRVIRVALKIHRISTFVRETEKLLNEGPRRISPLFIPTMIANIAAGNIAIRHNAQGPCLPIVTACATGTHSAGEAFRAIKFGLADAIITGGAEAAIHPMAIGGFANSRALTSSETLEDACTPFDARRSGFTMAEGAGIIILETLEHAQARGAKILAELVGYGLSADAYHLTSPMPEGEGAARCMDMAMKHAGLKPTDIQYINTHGTSTPLGDICETKAIKASFGDYAKNGLVVSSTKSMMGHLLGAAGAVEAIVCLKALNEGIIPPTINIEELDPAIDERINLTRDVAQKRDVRYALSNNFGFGGQNSTLILKRYEE